MSITLLSLLAIAAADPRPGNARGHEDYVERIPGTPVEFSMVTVCGGTFRIGSPISEPGRRDNEGPRRKVELRPFWMGKYEVTWDEYHAYMRETEYHTAEKAARPSTHPAAGQGRRGDQADSLLHRRDLRVRGRAATRRST